MGGKRTSNIEHPTSNFEILLVEPLSLMIGKLGIHGGWQWAVGGFDTHADYDGP